MNEGPASETLVEQLSRLVTGHPTLSVIMDRWADVGLPDAYLSGSIVAQARWNQLFGFDPHHGIDDIDIVYFDIDDLSADAEGQAERQIASLFTDLPLRVDVKNQARVHLWYPARFGHEIRPYRSITDAIGTFPTTSAAIGLRKHDSLDVIAPFGLVDLLRPVVRANATQIVEDYYESKLARWRRFWPELEILPWNEAVARQDRRGC